MHLSRKTIVPVSAALIGGAVASGELGPQSPSSNKPAAVTALINVQSQESIPYTLRANPLRVKIDKNGHIVSINNAKNYFPAGVVGEPGGSIDSGGIEPSRPKAGVINSTVELSNANASPAGVSGESKGSSDDGVVEHVKPKARLMKDDSLGPDNIYVPLETGLDVPPTGPPTPANLGTREAGGIVPTMPFEPPQN